MERALLWFKCAAMHDPVRPVIRRPALLGWEAKQRRVDLVIERSLHGEELLRRMKGWVTVDVDQAEKVISSHAKLKILDESDLVVEAEDKKALEKLSRKLTEIFDDEIWLELMLKNRLE
jgi:hypothetical protein